MLITMTGRPCSGKSTVCKILQDKYNFKVFSFGAIFKAEAQRRNLSEAEFSALRVNDPSFDFEIDKSIVPLAKEHENEEVIFDSRVAFHFLPHSFKVYLTLPYEIMGERLLNAGRGGKEQFDDYETALKNVKDRQTTERERYKKIYQFDLEDMSNYDLVVDSSTLSPEEIADKIYTEYKKFCAKKQK